MYPIATSILGHESLWRRTYSGKTQMAACSYFKTSLSNASAKGHCLTRTTLTFITKIKMYKLKGEQMKKFTILCIFNIKGLETKSGDSKRFVFKRQTHNLSISKL